MKTWSTDNLPIQESQGFSEVPGFNATKIDFKSQVDNKQFDFAVWSTSTPQTLAPGLNTITLDEFLTNAPEAFDKTNGVMKAGSYLFGFRSITDANSALSYASFRWIKQYLPTDALECTGCSFYPVNTDGAHTYTFQFYNGGASSITLDQSSLVYVIKLG